MSDDDKPAEANTRNALFDLRTVIGVLFAIYGVVCLIWGLVSFTDADRARTGGINLNLWAGIGMLLISAFFIGWVLLRPLQPTPEAAEPDSEAAADS